MPDKESGGYPYNNLAILKSLGTLEKAKRVQELLRKQSPEVGAISMARSVDWALARAVRYLERREQR